MKRPVVVVLALLVVLALARQAGVLPSEGTLRRAWRRFTEPPTRVEMDRAAARDSVRTARAAQAPTYTPADPPVTVGQMLLWFALPLVGTTLLVFVTERRGRQAAATSSSRSS